MEGKIVTTAAPAQSEANAVKSYIGRSKGGTVRESAGSEAAQVNAYKGSSARAASQYQAWKASRPNQYTRYQAMSGYMRNGLQDPAKSAEYISEANEFAEQEAKYGDEESANEWRKMAEAMTEHNSKENAYAYLSGNDHDLDRSERLFNDAKQRAELATDDEGKEFWSSIAGFAEQQSWQDRRSAKAGVQKQIDAVQQQIDNINNSMRSAAVADTVDPFAPFAVAKATGITEATGDGKDNPADELKALNAEKERLTEILNSYGMNTSEERDTAIARMQSYGKIKGNAYQEDVAAQRQADKERLEELKTELKKNPGNLELLREQVALKERANSSYYEELAESLYRKDQELVDEFDATWNGGARDYNLDQRVTNVMESWGQRTGAAAVNLGSTALRALDYETGADRSALAFNPEDIEAAKAIDTQQKDWEQRSKYQYDDEGNFLGRGIGNNTAFSRGATKLESVADQLDAESQQALAEAKNGLSKLGQFGVDLASTALDVGFDAVTGGGLTTMGLRVFGSSVGEARQRGATFSQQVGYGASKAAIEVATEKLGDGLGLVYGKGAATDITEKAIGKLAKTDAGANLLRIIAGTVSEGGEEVISDLLDPFAQMIISEEARNKDYFDQVDPSEVLYDFLLGAAMGLGGSGAEFATGGYTNKNYEQTAGMQEELDNAIPLSQRELDRYNADADHLAERLRSRTQKDVGKALKGLGVSKKDVSDITSQIEKPDVKGEHRGETILKNLAGGLEKGGYVSNVDKADAYRTATGLTPEEMDAKLDNRPPSDAEISSISQRRDAEGSGGINAQEKGGASVGLDERGVGKASNNEPKSSGQYTQEQKQKAKAGQEAIASGKTNNKKLSDVVKVVDSTVSTGKTIKSIKSNIFAKTGKAGEASLIDKVADWMDKKVGGRVFTKKIGGENGADIILNRRGIKNDIAYGVGEEKAATFQAVPDVLRNGQVVSTTMENGKPVSYIIASKVNLMGKPVNVYCLIKADSTDTNRFYLHEVSDGKGNLYYQLNDDGSVKGQSKGAPSALQDPLAVKPQSAEEAPAKESIPQKPTDSKHKASTNEAENGTIEENEGGSNNGETRELTVPGNDGRGNSGVDSLKSPIGTAPGGIQGDNQGAGNTGGQEVQRSSEEKISARINAITGKEATQDQIDAFSDALSRLGVTGDAIIQKSDLPPGAKLFTDKFKKTFGTAITVVQANPNSKISGANFRLVPELGVIVTTNAANNNKFGKASVHEGVHNVFRRLTGTDDNHIAWQAVNNLMASDKYGAEMDTAFYRMAYICSDYAEDIVGENNPDLARLRGSKSPEDVKAALKSMFDGNDTGKDRFEARVKEELYNDLVAGLNSRAQLTDPAEAIKYIREHFSNVSDIKAYDIEALIALGDRVGAGLSEKTVQQEGGETDAEEAAQPDYQEEAPPEPAGTQTNPTTPPDPRTPGVVDVSDSAIRKRGTAGEESHLRDQAKTLDERMNTGDGTYISKANADRSAMADAETTGKDAKETAEKSNRQYDRLLAKEKGTWTDDDVVIAQKLMGDMLKAVRDYQMGRKSKLIREGMIRLAERYNALALRHTAELSMAGQKLQAKYIFSVKEEILNRAAHSFLFTKDGRLSPNGTNTKIFAGMENAADKIEAAVEAKDAKALAQICKDISDIRGVKKMFGPLYDKVSEIESKILSDIAKQENGVQALETLAYGNLNAICDDIQPYKHLNAVKTIRVMNMLSNMSTIVNNVTNNIASGLTSTNALAQWSSRTAAKAFENVIGKPVLGKEAKGGVLFNKEIRTAEIEALKMATLVQMYGVNQENGKLELKGDKGLFNPNVNMFEQTMALYKFFIGMGVEATDQVKSAGLMKSMQKGIDELYAEEKISEGQKAEMEREAKHEVDRLLYKDDNALSNWIQGARNFMNRWHIGNEDTGTIGLGDLGMVFAKVPANVVRARLYATPEGCLLQLGQYAYGVMKAKRMHSETMARQIMESHALEKSKLNDELNDAYEMNAFHDVKQKAIEDAKSKLAALDRQCWKEAREKCSGAVYNKLAKMRNNYGAGLEFDSACKRCGYGEAVEMSQFEAANYSRKIGKAATSAGMVAAGVALRMLGALKDFDQEPDEELRKMMAQKGYSGLMFNWDAIWRKDHEWQDGDHLIDADFLEVVAMPLSIGATAAECAIDAEDEKSKAFMKSISTSGLGKTFEAIEDLPGMADTINFYNAVTNQFGKDTGAGDKVLDAAVEYLANALPTFLIPNAWTQFGAGIDNTVRDVYTADNRRKLAGNIILNKTAFLRRKIPASVDMWGEERHYGENAFMGWLNKQVLPGDIKRYHVNKYEAELFKLSKAGYTSALPKLSVAGSFEANGETYTMDADEKRLFKYERNKAQAEALKTFIDSATYQKLDDEQKTAVIKDLKMDCERDARQMILNNRGLDVQVTRAKWEDELGLDDSIKFLGAKQLASAAWNDEENSVGDYAAMDNFIKNEYGKLTPEMQKLLDNSLSHIDALYDAYSKAGITSEEWQIAEDIYREYVATDEDGKKIFKANMTNEAEMWAKIEKSIPNCTNKKMGWFEENMKLWYQGTPDTDQYYEYLNQAGLDRTTAAKTIDTIANLKPQPGYEDSNYIQNSQKYRTICQTVPKNKQWAAFWTIVPSNASKKQVAAMKEYQAEGYSLSEALTKSGMGKIQGRKPKGNGKYTYYTISN